MTTTTPAETATPGSGKAMLWTGRVLSAAFVLFMVMDIAIKLIGMKVVDDTMVQMGWPPELARGIGVMELIFVALYLFPRTSVLGAVLMTGVLGGAVATHVRIADPLFSHILFGVYLGLAMWGGLYLRDPRLRALFPIRR
ncbi:DoxX family protein [Phenylobacterium sp.]|uniref:DoxX family protein n=1 Tax=Phenylobacterium sp. TaxID=1871053 RepID=UPI002734C403|nr:DoxX family protein [Phenylobacterium sp.]MDP3660430.1 DoxX family protein [Phenylobacterium sp.]